MGRLVNDNAGPGRDPEAIASAEIARLVALLRPDKREGVVLSACQRLTIIFKNEPHHKKYLVMNRGVTSLIELLDLPSHQIAYSVLQVTRRKGKKSSSNSSNFNNNNNNKKPWLYV